MNFNRDTEKGMEESLLAEEKRKSETPSLTWVTFSGEIKRLGLLAGPMVAVTLSQYMLQVISIMMVGHLMVGHLGELALSSTAIAISLCGVTGFSLLVSLCFYLLSFYIHVFLSLYTVLKSHFLTNFY